MKYILKLSRIPDNERNIECISVRFNEEEYQLRLRALAEDINKITNNAEPKTIDGMDCIVIDSDLSEDSLLNKMKPFFQREFCYVRYVQLLKS